MRLHQQNNVNCNLMSIKLQLISTDYEMKLLNPRHDFDVPTFRFGELEKHLISLTEGDAEHWNSLKHRTFTGFNLKFSPFIVKTFLNKIDRNSNGMSKALYWHLMKFLKKYFLEKHKVKFIFTTIEIVSGFTLLLFQISDRFLPRIFFM